MKEKDEYLSLYEYLGRAAGSKLGAEIKKIAVENGVSTQMKDVPHSGFEGQVLTYPNVPHSGFEGQVLTYPKSFLELTFRPPYQVEVDEKNSLGN
jgi:hypothetical protein